MELESTGEMLVSHIHLDLDRQVSHCSPIHSIETAKLSHPSVSVGCTLAGHPDAGSRWAGCEITSCRLMSVLAELCQKWHNIRHGYSPFAKTTLLDGVFTRRRARFS